MITPADCGNESFGGDPTENSNCELWADATDGQQSLEEALLLDLGEAEESNLVLTDMSVDEQSGFSAFRRKLGEVATEMLTS